MAPATVNIHAGGRSGQSKVWFVYSFSLPLKDSGDSLLPSLNFSLPLNSTRVNTGNVFLVLFSLWWSTTSPLGSVCSRLRAQWVALTKVGPPPCTSRIWVMLERKEGGRVDKGESHKKTILKKWLIRSSLASPFLQWRPTTMRCYSSTHKEQTHIPAVKTPIF